MKNSIISSIMYTKRCNDYELQVIPTTTEYICCINFYNIIIVILLPKRQWYQLHAHDKTLPNFN